MCFAPVSTGGTHDQTRHNEQLRLSADYWNNLAVVAFSTGVVVPTISVSFAGQQLTDWKTFVPILLGLAIASFLRVVSHRRMGELKDVDQPPAPETHP